MSNKSSPPNHRLRSKLAEDVVKSGDAASMESSAASDYSLFMNENGHLVRLVFFRRISQKGVFG